MMVLYKGESLTYVNTVYTKIPLLLSQGMCSDEKERKINNK